MADKMDIVDLERVQKSLDCLDVTERCRAFRAVDFCRAVNKKVLNMKEVMGVGNAGGPNTAGNFVDAPMIVENASAFLLNPSFFHVAHFARYVRSA